jgi:hypothetical protein
MVAADEKIRKAVDEALFEYRRASRVAALAAADFEQHARNPDFTENSYTYMYHIDTAKGLDAMAVADGAYFNAMAAANGLSSTPAATKAELTALYQKALDLYYFALLRHDVEDEIAAVTYAKAANLPAGQLNKSKITMEMAKLFPQIYEATAAEYRRLGKPRNLEEATSEYSAYIERARQRLAVLKG